MAIRRKTGNSRPVSARTAAKRAAAHQSRTIRARRDLTARVETPGQAKVNARKRGRYLLAGLCETCATNASNGHSLGFGKIPAPCARCTPLVRAFPTPGPKGSPWRKILLKLEYLSPAALGEFLATLPSPNDDAEEGEAAGRNGTQSSFGPTVRFSEVEKDEMASMSAIRTAATWMRKTGQPLEEWLSAPKLTRREFEMAREFAVGNYPWPSRWTKRLFAVVTKVGTIEAES